MYNNDLLSGKIDGLSVNITRLKKRYISLWKNADTSFPVTYRKFSPDEKYRTEKQLDKLIDNVSTRLEEYPEEKKDQRVWTENLLETVREYSGEADFLSDLYLDTLLSDGFLSSTRLFINRVRKFDNTEKLSNVYQAIRNVWIANSLQLYMEQEITCSIPIFAYSMLYPYTDNINDSGISGERKRNFNRKLKKWLEGEDVEYENGHEERVQELVKKIEMEFSRKRFPGVFQSLLGIYNAQVKSLSTHNNSSNNDENGLLDISFEKGGTSVLADGFLINGSLNESQQSFCFGFGTFLQLADDLQDIDDDRLNGHNTLFMRPNGNVDHGSLVSRLLNYMNDVVRINLTHRDDKHKVLKELILNNCFFLIMEAIGKNSELFEKEYISLAESYCPVSFSYISHLRARLTKKISKENGRSISLDMMSEFLLTLSQQNQKK